ncbi:MAG: PAS domain S-box protein, partial [Dehalococcoidia bacterium]
MINFVTILHFVSFTANVLLAAFIIGRNPKALLNRVCFLLIATFAFWCFYSARLTMAQNYDDAMFFINMSSIGWAFMPVASLWFCLALDKKGNILKNWVFIAATTLVAAVFVYAQWAGELFYTCVPASWGWTPIWKMSAAAYAYYFYNIVIAGILVYLLIDFGRKARSHSQKMQARILLITGIIAMALSSMTDIIFRIFDIRAVPDIADVFFVIGGFGIVYAVFKYGLMSLTPRVAAETILNTISDSIILLDTKMQIVYTNQATTALLGYSEKEIKGSHFSSVVTDKKATEDLLKDTLQAGSVNHELSYLSKSGKTIPVLIATSIIFNSEHNNIGIALSVKDITIRKQIEEALKQSEEKYRLVIENAREGVCIAVEGLCKFANRGILDMTGYSLEEFTSKPFIEFIHHNDRSRIAESYSKWISGIEVASSYTFRCISKSGDIRWMELSAVPIMWEGKPAALTLITDITERRQLQEEQQRVEKLESIGLLAGGIAHDFNNILTAILGNISLARLDAPPGSEVHENLEQAEKASLRAKELTKQLLTFSKGGAPMM